MSNMSTMNFVTSVALLALSPTMLVYPQEFPSVHEQSIHIQHHAPSYDDILHLLDEIESGELERRASPEELERVKLFVAFLAKEGALPDGSDESLEEDIADLLQEENSIAFGIPGEYMVIPAIFQGDAEIFLCKSWVQKQWKHVKKFVKKHKTAIIIGTVIVVATVAVVVAVAASAGAATAVAGVAGAAASASSSESHYSQYEEEASPALVQEAPISMRMDETSIIKSVIEEQVAPLKEMLLEDVMAQESAMPMAWDDLSFCEKAREIGANITHKALEEIADLARVVPQLCEEVRDIGSRFLTGDFALANDGTIGSPIENYENLIVKGHQVIDKAFSTDQAVRYTREAKANNLGYDFTVGILPLPGLAKSPSEAYITAKNGGRHADLIPKFSKKPIKEIEKSIHSYEKLIAEHKDKIANPSKYCPDWDNFHPNRQKALVEKVWPSEIQCFTEQRDILKIVLDQRN